MLTRNLRAERAKIISDAQKLISAENPSAEDLATFDNMLADADKLMAQIDRIEKANELNAGLAEIVGETAEQKKVSVAEAEDEVVREKRIMTQLLRGGMRALTENDRQIVAQRMSPIQNTPMSTGSNSGGGYTIAPAFARELLVAMKAQGGVRAVARNLITDTGVALPWPTLDDRSNNASIISENTQITEDTELTFGQVTINSYTYKSGVLLVSLQLLNDSAFDFDSVIRDAIAGRFVRAQNAHFTTGTGSSQPQGIVTAASSGKVGTTGQTTSVIYDDLVDLIHAVDPVYRPGSAFMMHDSSVKVIRKLKDSQGHPLWQPSITAGVPDTILGYPLVVNQDMATMAANAKSIVFGNFNNYLVRDVVGGVQMMVMRERWGDYLQVGYIAFTRSDGRLISAASPLMYYANSAT